MRPAFEQEKLQNHLNGLVEFSQLACYKYVLAQPVIVAAVAADGFTGEDILKLAKKFETSVLHMQELSAEMGGFKVGTSHIGGRKLSVTGVLLWVFFDHSRAAEFISKHQKNLKTHSFTNKAWVLPWVIDVSARRVFEHAGLPFMGGMLSRDFLQKEIFDTDK